MHFDTCARIPRVNGFDLSSALCFVQGASLRLCGRFRNVDLLSCSQRPLRPKPLLGTNFQSCMLPTQHYHGTKEIDPLTVDDYHVLIETGRLDDRRVELLNGLLVKTHAQSVEHSATVRHLVRIFSSVLDYGNRAVVSDSKPITLKKANSEPEPDIVIASGSPEDYDYRHPAPDDILLLVEVSKSTLHRDRTVKLELYASENIQEYWIVDITSRSVRMLRHPQEKYYLYDETSYAGDIFPVAFPDVVINVEELFRRFRGGLHV